MTFEKAEELAKMPLVEPGTYEFVVDRIDDSNTVDGRPRWVVFLRIVNNERFANRVLIYNAVLPWIDPTTGQWDTTGIGLLTQLCQGTATQWLGDLRKPEVQATLKQALMGKTGFMRVGYREYVDSTTGEKTKANRVRIVTGRR
ncbi:MAG: hypothetical protein QXQ53_01270 [Candidatus Methanosuratincola sp.]